MHRPFPCAYYNSSYQGWRNPVRNYPGVNRTFQQPQQMFTPLPPYVTYAQSSAAAKPLPLPDSILPMIAPEPPIQHVSATQKPRGIQQHQALLRNDGTFETPTPPMSAPSEPDKEFLSFAGPFILSCLTTWIFGIVFGVIAFWFAINGQNEASSGNIGPARRLYRLSCGVSVVGIVVGFVVVIIIGSVGLNQVCDAYKCVSNRTTYAK